MQDASRLWEGRIVKYKSSRIFKLFSHQVPACCVIYFTLTVYYILLLVNKLKYYRLFDNIKLMLWIFMQIRISENIMRNIGP